MLRRGRWEATLKITALLATLLIGMVLPGLAIADEQAASFKTRWPETPMRKPTMTELIRLVASAAKDDIKLVIESGSAGNQQGALRCPPELCRLLNRR
jgi:hypothetical protein